MRQEPNVGTRVRRYALSSLIKVMASNTRGRAAPMARCDQAWRQRFTRL